MKGEFALHNGSEYIIPQENKKASDKDGRDPSHGAFSSFIRILEKDSIGFAWRVRGDKKRAPKRISISKVNKEKIKNSECNLII